MSRALDIMTRDPITVRENSTLRVALQLLRGEDIRHLPVVDVDGALVGMLSDRDLRGLSIVRTDSDLTHLLAAYDLPVSKLMSTDVICVEEETETSEIIELMLEHKVGALPVLDAEEALVGIVSYIDVLRSLRALESAQ